MVFTNAAIAFDLDGTLVDTAPDLIGALNLILAERGLAPAPVSAARHLVGGGARRLLEKSFAEAGAAFPEDEAEALVEQFLRLYGQRVADESVPFEGVATALDSLRAEGARLLVCTNKRTDLSLALLEAVGLLDRFEAVVGADRVSARKPSAAHLLEALALAGAGPERALMVGDSMTDVRAARAAGVPVVAVSFGYSDVPPAELGADALIHRFAELPPVARGLFTRVA